MKQTAICALIFLAGSFSVSAEVYRCEIDGVVTFTDRACPADAQPYQPSAGLSVISAPSDLDRTRMLNQAFIRERLDHQAARDEARAVRSAQNAQRPAVKPAPIVALPFYGFHHELPARRRSGRRPGQLDQAPGQQPFSALSGPFPGTRRDRERRP
ncbi:MAG: hypothetical protein ACNA7J_01590 [Wenzhouxiangella sp.]